MRLVFPEPHGPTKAITVEAGSLAVDRIASATMLANAARPSRSGSFAEPSIGSSEMPLELVIIPTV